MFPFMVQNELMKYQIRGPEIAAALVMEKEDLVDKEALVGILMEL